MLEMYLHACETSLLKEKRSPSLLLRKRASLFSPMMHCEKKKYLKIKTLFCACDTRKRSASILANDLLLFSLALSALLVSSFQFLS